MAASTYRTPGVYIEEIPSFPSSIVAVDTAIPAFIGFTETAKREGRDLEPFTAVRITSLIEYENIFGGPQQEENIIVEIVPGLDGKVKYVVKFEEADGKAIRSKHILYYSLQLFFQNGGKPCYIISTGTYSAIGTLISDATPYLNALEKLEKQDEPTLIVFPEGQNIETDTYFQILNAALPQCQKLKDRFLIMDLHHDGSGLKTSDDLFRDDANNPGKILEFRNKIAGTEDFLKYGAVYFPNIYSDFNYAYNKDKVKINEGTASKSFSDLNGLQKVAVKAAIDNFSINLPPSGAVAGIYTRVDNSRGVWKAPGNEPVLSVSALTFEVNDTIQDLLNVDVVAGKSINAIRFFSGKGIKIWGVRTLAGNSNEWRYVSVRRYFNMVEESTKKATEQFVFEPNDANTWVKVKAMIENFLMNQWRDGALAGAKPEHAFFVRVGLNQTMTALDILEGYMIIEIGLAVVRPAEFIVLRFSHKMQES